MSKVIALDIGGTVLSSAVVNNEHQLSHRLNEATRSDDGEALFEQVVKLIEETMQADGEELEAYEGIGLCVAGKVDPKAGIAVFQHHLPWPDFPLVERLKERFPNITIRMDNDMYAAGMAEYYTRNIPQDEIFVYCTLSTGTGIAIIQNGHIIRGHGYAGEVGYLPIWFPHRQEKFLYTSAGNGLKRSTEGKLEAKEIFDLAHAGDPKAKQLIEEGEEGITQMLHAVMCLLDPYMIVFGGSVSLKQPSYIQKAVMKLKGRLTRETSHILEHIELSTLGADNGLLGAAQLIFQKEQA